MMYCAFFFRLLQIYNLMKIVLFVCYSVMYLVYNSYSTTVKQKLTEGFLKCEKWVHYHQNASNFYLKIIGTWCQQIVPSFLEYQDIKESHGRTNNTQQFLEVSFCIYAEPIHNVKYSYMIFYPRITLGLRDNYTLH